MSTATQTKKTYDRTVQEMADKTGFSREAFTYWIRKEKLSATTRGNHYLLNEDEVMQFVATRKTRKKFQHLNHTG